MFSSSDRHRRLNRLRWQNMLAHLINETSDWLKKLLMHRNLAIYNVSDLNMDPHVCFFPTLLQDRARPIPLAQPEACPQRSERPVCARSPHKSRNGYRGWCQYPSYCTGIILYDLHVHRHYCNITCVSWRIKSSATRVGYLFNGLSRLTSSTTKTETFRITEFCDGNLPVADCPH